MARDFEIVVRWANRQHGRVSTVQAAADGVGPQRLARWAEQGLLHHEHQGVYAVGHVAPSPLGELMAAVLACGPKAFAGYASCTYLLDVTATAPRKPEVLVRTSAPIQHPRISVHRTRRLHPLDHGVWEGIPTTTLPRALLDLAPRWSVKQLTRAWHEGYVRHGLTPAAIEACMLRNPRRPGVRKLRRALGADVTLSMLEDAFLDLLRRHGIALPRTNIDVRGHKVDCHWPALSLTIELLGYRFHASRHAFERDVARQRRTGHVAFTWGDVVERGDATIREVRALMTGRGV